MSLSSGMSVADRGVEYETEVMSLRKRLDLAQRKLEDQAISLSAERDAARELAASSTDKSKKLQTCVDSVRLELTAVQQDYKALEISSDEYYSEAIKLQSIHIRDERRIRELEQTVVQREKTVHSLRENNADQEEEIRRLGEEIARLQAANKALTVENASLKKEKKLLTIQKDGLVEQNESLEEQIVTLRERSTRVKSTSQEHVELQSSQLKKVTSLLKKRERNLEQLEQGNEELQEKCAENENQLSRAYEILRHWPGGLPDAYLDVLKKGHPMPAGPVPSQREARKLSTKLQVEEEVENEETEEGDDSESPFDADHSLSDENMTSAFIIPDITLQTNREDTATQPAPVPPLDDCHVVNIDVETMESDNEAAAPATATVLSGIDNRAASPSKSHQRKRSARSQSSASRHVEFLDETVERQAPNDGKGASVPTLSREARRVLSELCAHKCDNCSICSRIRSHRKHESCTMTVTMATTVEGAKESKKALVRVPRPTPVSDRMPRELGEHEDEPTMRPARSPAEALARVMKGLEDELAHLQLEASVECNRYYALDKSMGNRHCEASEAGIGKSFRVMVAKRKQLYDLYDVLEGQKAAGQLMTEEEVEMTIASIMHQEV